MNTDDFSGFYLDLFGRFVTVSSSKETQKTHEPLPSFFVRWFIFFRLHPYSFRQPIFLFDIIVRRKRFPVLWDNVMEAEKRRIARKKEEEEIKNLTL